MLYYEIGIVGIVILLSIFYCRKKMKKLKEINNKFNDL